MMNRVEVTETIGQRIRRERLVRGLTQRQLAEAVHVGVPHISKVEADRESPGDDLLIRLASVLEVDPDELFVVARRLPETMLEGFAAKPAEAVKFLRTFSPRKPAG
jgi:transcriptional regulator with XRE-family HTH domain